MPVMYVRIVDSVQYILYQSYYLLDTFLIDFSASRQDAIHMIVTPWYPTNVS